MSGKVSARPNDWESRSIHVCYFCRPEAYPTMPPRHTLCARCGVLIEIDNEDPKNLAMEVCQACDAELE